MKKKTISFIVACVVSALCCSANAQTYYYYCSRCGQYHAYRPVAQKVAEVPKKVVEAPKKVVEGAASAVYAIGDLAEANRIRAQYGLRPLILDPALQAGCQRHSQWMASYRSLQHASGYAEIIAMHPYGNVNFAFQQWLNSPAHRNLLLSPYYTRAGFAFARDRNGYTWCTMRFR